jgi:polyphosphate kinase
MGADATDLFNFLTGIRRKPSTANCWSRRSTCARTSKRWSARDRTRAGNKARLIFKMNSLVDPHMIQLLYKPRRRASKWTCSCAACAVCVPASKGVSENIRVISVVGRYLEHSRLYYFQNNGGRRSISAAPT